MIGERKAIELILGRLNKMANMPIPLGDDVSACPLTNNRLAVLKTDMLVGKTDVPKGMSPWQAARKAVVMNVSDFAAKGVKPLVMLASLGFPGSTSERELEEIAGGLNAGAREYDAYIVGGDTGEASDLIISISVFGIARKGKVMLRSGAKPGDVVAVTGFFGKTSVGLKILLEDVKAPRKIHDALVEAVYIPNARLSEGIALSRTEAVTASIDSSDGLAWSLHEISKASGVGVVVDILPVAPEAQKFAEAHNLDPFELAFYGGEEYELVLTLKPEYWSKAEKTVEKAGGRLIKIGRVTRRKKIVAEVDGGRRIVEPRGWEHFKKNKD